MSLPLCVSILTFSLAKQQIKSHGYLQWVEYNKPIISEVDIIIGTYRYHYLVVFLSI